MCREDERVFEELRKGTEEKKVCACVCTYRKGWTYRVRDGRKQGEGERKSERI